VNEIMAAEGNCSPRAEIHQVFQALRARILATPSGRQLDHLLFRGSGGVWSEVAPAGLSFATAIAVGARSGPALLICPDQRTCEELADELATWIPGGEAFPEMTAAVVEEILPDPEIVAARLQILARMVSKNPPPWVAVTESQLASFVPVPETGEEAIIVLAPGMELPPETLEAKLLDWGHESVPKVYGRGQFSRRGGILDIFTWRHPRPLRLEFFDTQLESLREFDLDSQISTRRIDAAEIAAPPSETGQVPLENLLKNWRRIAIEPPEPHSIANFSYESMICSAIFAETPSLLPIYPCPEAKFTAGDFVLNAARRATFFQQLARWRDELWEVVFFCDNEGEWQRFRELARNEGVDVDFLRYAEGHQAASFVCPEARIAVLTDSDVFGRANSRRIQRLARRGESLFAGREAEDFAEFVEGDYVVHVEHGIGKYLGMRRIEGEAFDQLAIEFAHGAILYVPLEQAWQISRYIGLGKRHPELSELGTQRWARTKARTLGAVFSYAKELLRIQAERETSVGHAFPKDTEWQLEFEKAFPFRETPDQLKAIHETKRDMESSRPMDRLICGDVGFGKTEVAIRAAFKAVTGGRQVAFLAPTTVLAQQHFETLCERMSDYPIRIGLLSRFRSKSEQAKTIAAVASGEIDIVVGTHRILSKDVQWKNLGLLIVDEEQRFGVRHKERMKERFRLVDVLTLSATPIPRTLYLALMGARDMSLIETPPPNRQPVETIVCSYDERILRDAVKRELERGGQVYVLHNRVRTIDALAERIRNLVPGARVLVAHGQMDDRQLEDIMHAFVEGRADVLVSTTIIESGLDIPNANTILIDRADLFGLADLYQLRGRVGRSGTKAFAYLFLPRGISTGDARKRLSAIKQYSHLGAGFKIAMRDLEIRGAGNILGTEQSGHIVTVGFDLYCKMLRMAIEKLQNGGHAKRLVCSLRLDFIAFSEGEFARSSSDEMGPAFLPAAYITDTKMRIEAYRKLNEAETPEVLEKLGAEWRDRFGPLPEAVTNLLLCMRLQLVAGSLGFSMLEVKGSRLMLTRKGDYLLLNGKFPRLEASEPAEKLQEIFLKISSLAATK